MKSCRSNDWSHWLGWTFMLRIHAVGDICMYTYGTGPNRTRKRGVYWLSGPAVRQRVCRLVATVSNIKTQQQHKKKKRCRSCRIVMLGSFRIVWCICDSYSYNVVKQQGLYSVTVDQGGYILNKLWVCVLFAFRASLYHVQITSFANLEITRSTGKLMWSTHDGMKSGKTRWWLNSYCSFWRSIMCLGNLWFCL